jgi:DNA repair exonuclease SbcCD ATPase subunit
MRINSIEFKNFASYGNSIQRIEFGDEAQLYLTLGKNGHGKTTIANSIIYALYGKVEGVKLADLPNRINKELWVKINITCKDMLVEIERGLMPGRFKVMVNGVEFDKAGKRSVQEYLEDEIFGIPYHVFKNIIILSINDFKSFLTMNSGDKKQIIDKMFGFSVLNDMFREVKEERKQIKMEVDSYNSELNQIMESISSVRLKLNNLMEDAHHKDKVKIEQLKKNLLGHGESIQKLTEAKENIHEKLEQSVDFSNEMENSQRDILRDNQYIEEKIKLYEKGKCPTCETSLTSTEHLNRLADWEVEKSTNEDKIVKLKKIIEEAEERIGSLKTKKKQVETRSTNIKYSIKEIKEELIKIKETTNNKSQFQHLKQIIKDFEKTEKQKSKKKVVVEKEDAFMGILEEVLGDDGVKNLAVKTILPGLNANIAMMVQTMHLPFHIRFNEKFDCIVNHLGEDINPLTLSTGERKKADFIVIIAIIKILKLRFPQLNLMFLDELLSSVDQDGVYNILKILNEVIKENGLNTFVINHTELPHEIFDQKIQIYRENGFSKFEIEKID